MSIPKTIGDHLQRVPWFSRCGLSEDVNIDFPYRFVSGWNEASVAFSDPAWETITAEAQGKLTEYLSSKFPAEYQGRWNQTAKQARVLIDAVVMPAARELQTRIGLSQVFLDCVQWDTLHGVMELVYADRSPHAFFRNLLSVYEQGHFPCGWADGEWPDGVLLLI